MHLQLFKLVGGRVVMNPSPCFEEEAHGKGVICCSGHVSSGYQLQLCTKKKDGHGGSFLLYLLVV